jgi:hypothetical protein
LSRYPTHSSLPGFAQLLTAFFPISIEGGEVDAERLCQVKAYAFQLDLPFLEGAEEEAEPLEYNPPVSFGRKLLHSCYYLRTLRVGSL